MIHFDAWAYGPTGGARQCALSADYWRAQDGDARVGGEGAGASHGVGVRKK